MEEKKKRENRNVQVAANQDDMGNDPGGIQRPKSVHTVLSQPVRMPTPEVEMDGHCSQLQPSRKAKTSSPPRLAYHMALSAPS